MKIQEKILIFSLFLYENPVKYDMGSKQLRLRAVKMFDDKEYLWRIS